MRIHEQRVSNIRSCNVAYLLVVSIQFGFVMCACTRQGGERFLVLSMTGGREWFSISRTCVTSMWHAGTEVAEGQSGGHVLNIHEYDMSYVPCNYF